MKIGDFAKIFDVSIKTIRFYEEKGLINPSYIDIYTGYRYYDDENIKQMCKILAFKNLGLELKEIKNIDSELIQLKIKEYEENINKIKSNINILKSLSIDNNGEVIDMKTFVNDQNAIGKWQLIGISNTKEDYLKGKLIEDNDYIIDELYLMKNGESYWVISWSKNIIYINGKENPYEIDNDIMYVTINGLFDTDESKVAIYKKIDNKEYTKNEIKIKDNINLSFESDEKAIGFYKSVDYIRNIDSFNVDNKSYDGELYLDRLSLSPDGNVTINYKDGIVKNTNYSKDYIVNIVLQDTLCKYILKDINNKTYMFVEWKSGDYVYGKHVLGYYVLEKLELK